MLSEEKIKQAVDAGIIDPIIHDRVLANSSGLTVRAKIPEGALLYSLKDYCNPEEIKTLLKIKELQDAGGCGGFIYVKEPNVVKKFQALCGFLIRNFVDGVIMPAHETIQDKSEVASECGVLLIPDLYREVLGAGQSAWKADNAKIVALIDNRRLKGKLTIIHIDNWAGVQNTFGTAFAEMLQENYIEL
jgi:hypothetical protein